MSFDETMKQLRERREKRESELRENQKRWLKRVEVLRFNCELYDSLVAKIDADFKEQNK